MKYFSVFCFFIFFPFFVSAEVIISEVAWMGTEISSSDEWLELYNSGSESVDLSGWQIITEDGGLAMSLAGVLQADNYFLLERTNDDTISGVVADKIYTGALADAGEILILKDAVGNEIFKIDAMSGWLAGDKTVKKTMEFNLVNQTWQTSATVGGTPKSINSAGEVMANGNEENNEEDGEIASSSTVSLENQGSSAADFGKNYNLNFKAEAGENIAALLGSKIKLSAAGSLIGNIADVEYEWNMGNGEILKGKEISYEYLFAGNYVVTLVVSGDKGKLKSLDSLNVKMIAGGVIISEFMPDPEGADSGNEWIELFNSSSRAIDLSGWALDDAADGGSKPFVFPENSFIAPLSFLVLTSNITKISLNNTNDMVRLIFPVGDLMADAVSYGKIKEGQSAARKGETFLIIDQSTPGMANFSFAGDMEFYNDYTIDLSGFPEADLSGGKVTPMFEERKPLAVEAMDGESESGISNSNISGILNGKEISDENMGREENQKKNNAGKEFIVENVAGSAGKIAARSGIKPITKQDIILILAMLLSAGILMFWWKNFNDKNLTKL